MKLNRMQIDVILKGIAGGLDREDACRKAGIDRASLSEWLRCGAEDAGSGRRSLNRELFERIAEAEVECEAWHLRNISSAADRDWKASAWFLERTRRERYARRSLPPEMDEEGDELTVIG
ncbi:hypothetical protein [Chlorobium sp. N1]|uniref:hypothetical protein n=1 Tax=Chlorobium sp. N1 TaxID=2491138 RepID=UPI00103B7EB6|nr:hypothetical protein [Chlorobium sp. N1]TCD47024.1 hypothetical protein E0L29_10340 [Chlorobium sp. N1]